jgi:dipeptidyl aminopeptidase/acylaminoacyl peptidase
MSKKILILPIIALTIVIALVSCRAIRSKEENKFFLTSLENQQFNSNPLSIEYLRQEEYPGSEIIIEETLEPGSNYQRYLASYQSGDLKIFGLLTVPNGSPPENGWPVIIFNHGYIPPEQYQTQERYVAYVDGFARNGYLVFKSDYRGHGDSEGKPEGAYYSAAYTIDVLNAIASLKRFEEANSDEIGMWGHSLGGNLTLRAMVVIQEIKAGVIWSGVVGTYEELLTQWRRERPWRPSNIERYGQPEDNPEFWQSIDPRYFLQDISGPLQLHVGLADEEVPPLFSESLRDDLEKQNKSVEFYAYEGADHNLSSPAFELAMKRSVEFFDEYLKNEEAGG